MLNDAKVHEKRNHLDVNYNDRMMLIQFKGRTRVRVRKILNVPS